MGCTKRVLKNNDSPAIGNGPLTLVARMNHSAEAGSNLCEDASNEAKVSARSAARLPLQVLLRFFQHSRWCRNRRLILSWVKALGGVSWRMRKKEKNPISIGPQFYTLLALTETIVTELRWGRKQGRRSGKTSERLVEQPRHIRRRLTGKLKIERL